MDDWQPIETAPDDGENILVFGGRHDVVQIVKADGSYWRFDKEHGRGRSVPTHWRPLPAPPTRKNTGAT